jgi:hypothetical protein
VTTFDRVTVLIEQHVVGSLLKQGRLGPFLGGEPRWSADFGAATMQIAGIDFPVDLLGAESGDGTFTWSWAIEEVADASSTSARALREAGERLGVRELTTPQVAAAEFDGLRAALIGSGIARADAHLLAENEGLRFAFLLRHPELAAKPITVGHLPRVWGGVTQSVAFDHRRAFEAFAEAPLDGIQVTPEERGYRLDGPDTGVRLELD